jgi:hypothetical protein
MKQKNNAEVHLLYGSNKFWGNRTLLRAFLDKDTAVKCMADCEIHASQIPHEYTASKEEMDEWNAGHHLWLAHHPGGAKAAPFDEFDLDSIPLT